MNSLGPEVCLHTGGNVRVVVKYGSNDAEHHLAVHGWPQVVVFGNLSETSRKRVGTGGKNIWQTQDHHLAHGRCVTKQDIMTTVTMQ